MSIVNLIGFAMFSIGWLWVCQKTEGALWSYFATLLVATGAFLFGVEIT